MARSVTGVGSDNSLLCTGFELTATPLTIACWFKTTNLTHKGFIVSITESIDYRDGSFGLRFAGDVAGDPIHAVAGGGSNEEFAETTTGVTSDVWHHGCAVFTDDSDRAVYIDGGSEGTSAATRAVSGIDRTFIGRTANEDKYFIGDVAEVGIWDAVLTADERAALAAGCSPLLIRRESLRCYLPLGGRYVEVAATAPRNLIDNTDEFVITGSCPVVDSPIVITHPGRARVGIGLLTVAARTRGSYRVLETITAAQQGSYRVLSPMTGATHGSYQVYNLLTQRVRGSYRHVITYSVRGRARYRVANAAKIGYVAYVGEDGPPDFSAAPAATSTTLPMQIPITPPGAGEVTFYVVVRSRNAYGLESQNQFPTKITVDSNGDYQGHEIVAPLVQVFAIAGPKLRVLPTYKEFLLDVLPADKWRVWVDTVTPDTNDPVTHEANVVGKNFMVDLTGYAAGTYFISVGLYRTDDTYLSPVTTVEVTIPAVLNAPLPVITGYQIPPPP